MSTYLTRESFLIPPGYDVINPQQQSLVYGIPWIAVEAAMTLNRWLEKTHVALDLGLGGSTVFYAARCQKVYGVEVDVSKSWEPAMLKALSAQELTNTELRFVATEAEVVQAINELDVEFDLISVDTYHPLNRELFFVTALPKLKPGGVVVMDNYTDCSLWGQTGACSPEQVLAKHGLTGRVLDFPQPGWSGHGTRLIFVSSK